MIETYDVLLSDEALNDLGEIYRYMRFPCRLLWQPSCRSTV